MRKLLIIPLVLIAVIGGVIILTLDEDLPVVLPSDQTLVIREELPSPDGRHVVLIYQFDTGAFGYSRLWWAVVPKDCEQRNLAQFVLPDRYRIAGWDSTGVLIIEEWEPYYYPKRDAVLATGELLHGVPIRVVALGSGKGRE